LSHPPDERRQQLRDLYRAEIRLSMPDDLEPFSAASSTLSVS